jgi:glycosyltransferase involved in cell wall biosynthesis
VFVSVLICSDSRASSLGRTLESLFSRTNLQAGNWEALVVIDRDARDGTADLCRSFEQRFSGIFRFLIQKKTGKSNALNVAISSARGDVLAMTDDDVLCAPDYIQAIQTVFSRYSVAGVQGRVLPDFEGGPPRWISPDFAWFLSLLDFGDEIKDWNYTLSGTNMAVRADAARAVGGFSPELGPGGAGFAEDTDFSFRLLGVGCCFIYAPQIVVRHQLSRERLTKAFLRKRYFGLGRSRAYFTPLEVPLWRFGLYVIKCWVLKAAEAAWNICTNRPAKALHCECKALEQAGFFWQHWRFHHGVPRQLSRVTSWSESPAQGSGFKDKA